ncbi:DUF2963 domain-containing protein [Candidatus Phytoplasma pruni]|uniref:DUF2963 domain-containing protein n=1 Tax=Candidatus Phytoplasma pruni TaxID=479893 RepID=A0A851H9T3_9MOLU|nr:hypothetical protein [Candidatus Phytoplasma pruni]NWN45637.1 hypothetical protein [Candidatus Phytoplasma pruni]
MNKKNLTPYQAKIKKIILITVLEVIFFGFISFNNYGFNPYQRGDYPTDEFDKVINPNYNDSYPKDIFYNSNNLIGPITYLSPENNQKIITESYYNYKKDPSKNAKKKIINYDTETGQIVKETDYKQYETENKVEEKIMHVSLHNPQNGKIQKEAWYMEDGENKKSVAEYVADEKNEKIKYTIYDTNDKSSETEYHPNGNIKTLKHYKSDKNNILKIHFMYEFDEKTKNKTKYISYDIEASEDGLKKTMDEYDPKNGQTIKTTNYSNKEPQTDIIHSTYEYDSSNCIKKITFYNLETGNKIRIEENHPSSEQDAKSITEEYDPQTNNKIKKIIYFNNGTYTTYKYDPNAGTLLLEIKRNQDGSQIN